MNKLLIDSDLLLTISVLYYISLNTILNAMLQISFGSQTLQLEVPDEETNRIDISLFDEETRLVLIEVLAVSPLVDVSQDALLTLSVLLKCFTKAFY